MFYKTIEPFTIKIENGILIGTYNVGFADIELAEKAYKARIETTNNKSYPTLIDMRSLVSYSKEAKEFLSSAAAYKDISAGVLLVQTVFQKIAANFYLYGHKCPIPTKIFTEERAAIKWLEQFKEK